MVEQLFAESVRQFGLPVGLLLVAVVILARVAVVQNRESTARYERALAQQQARITELEAETVVLRERLIEAISAAEVGERATKRLAGGSRRHPGDR